MAQGGVNDTSPMAHRIKVMCTNNPWAFWEKLCHFESEKRTFVISSECNEREILFLGWLDSLKIAPYGRNDRRGWSK